MSTRVQSNQFGEVRLIERDAAYLAGLFDGEGSVYLVARKQKGRRSHHFHPEMTLSSTSLPLLKTIVELTSNGAIYQSGSKGVNHKAVYRWQLQPSQIRAVLPALRPYLRLKGAQADLMMEFFDLQQQADRGPWGGANLAVIERIIALYGELRSLNHRGLTEPERLDFQFGEGKERKRTCDHEQCDNRRYRGHLVCYAHWLQTSERLSKVCEECGSGFEAVLPKARFCTKRCQWRNAAARRKSAAEGLEGGPHEADTGHREFPPGPTRDQSRAGAGHRGPAGF